MNREIIENYIGKKIKLILKGNSKGDFHYNTENLLIVDDDTVTFTDRYGTRVSVSIEQIVQILEERGATNGN